MARIRTIKPEFFMNDRLAELSPLHRLVFIGLWTLADREGRLEDRPKRIKAELFPWDKGDADALLADLDHDGCIQRYAADGQSYIAIPNFLKHQRPHFKESASTIPEPPRRVPAPIQVGASTLGREGKGREGDQEGKGMEQPAVAAPVLEVFEYWAMKLDHPKAKLGPERRKLIGTQLKAAGNVEDLKLAVDGVLVDIEAWPDRRRFDGVEYVFESRASVEKYMDLARKGNPKPKVDPRKGFLRAEDQDWSNIPMGKVS